jgi:hypothetical protein
MQTTDDNATDRDEETNHPLLIQSGKSCNPGDSPPRSVVSDQSHQYRSVTSDFSFGIDVQEETDRYSTVPDNLFLRCMFV